MRDGELEMEHKIVPGYSAGDVGKSQLQILGPRLKGSSAGFSDSQVGEAWPFSPFFN